MESIYFSHPISTFGSVEKLGILRAVHQEYPDYSIIDPEDIIISSSASCKDCMENIMKKTFFPLIEKASLFILWEPEFTCRMGCEMCYAWQISKPCIHVSGQFDEIEFEDISLREHFKIEALSYKLESLI